MYKRQEYTLSTCQLDFCLPAKFHLTYVDKDGSEKTPVVLHRAIPVSYTHLLLVALVILWISPYSLSHSYYMRWNAKSQAFFVYPQPLGTVSYTHLDVYKRQVPVWAQPIKSLPASTGGMAAA